MSRAARERWARDPAKMREAVRNNGLKGGAWSDERFALDAALDALRAYGEAAAAALRKPRRRARTRTPDTDTDTAPDSSPRPNPSVRVGLP